MPYRKVLKSSSVYKTRRCAVLVPIIMLSACFTRVPIPSQYDAGDIDRLYLEIAKALQHPEDAQVGIFRRLTMQVEELAADQHVQDPCLEQKRRQLMPVLISLGVIDGLRNADEQRALRIEALYHLASLSRPDVVTVTGDICFGRGFPRIMVGKP